MREEVIQTILESLRYSKRKIQDHDYSYGHYDPNQVAANEQMRRENLKKIDEAEKDIRKIWEKKK